MSNDNINRHPVVGEVWYFPTVPFGILNWKERLIRFTMVEAHEIKSGTVKGVILNGEYPSYYKDATWFWHQAALDDAGAILIPPEIVDNPESLKLHIALLTGNVTDES